ncbi:TPA: recombination protein RecR [Candidatus Sumerlaeota bacterium]|jgi:recombination protein RecR|nr:recombination protein RecR [Candidatus Sumerlaeota bacterium]
MPTIIPPSLEAAITHLSKLPTIGRRSAERLAFHLLKAPKTQVEELASALLTMREKLIRCSHCHHICEQDPCPICRDTQRDPKILCVVEDPLDVLAIETAGVFGGKYHILGGCLSPLKGVTASDLNLHTLDARVEQEGVTELILAMNPSVEGEATILFLTDRFRSRGIRVSRIALGLPMGGSLEHADGQTLEHALRGRRDA